ncbi:unnamed protein product [Brassica napus]|uniref:(rape) hypothetical protein n=1 Tax=Brassica napus TaxID=3708 RepID=A0A816P3D1_BRANA|nr:unnamed protein product [Brassica napus]
MNIRSERLLVLKHNPCSDHVRAPLTPPMTIVRINMNFFETYEFSPQLTTRLSRKPISSPRRHNRTQTVCELACRKRIDVLDLPPDIQPHSRRSTSRTIIVSKIVHGKTLHKFGACNRYTDSRLLSFCQLLRWELLPCWSEVASMKNTWCPTDARKSTTSFGGWLVLGLGSSNGIITKECSLFLMVSSPLVAVTVGFVWSLHVPVPRPSSPPHASFIFQQPSISEIFTY